MWCRHCGQDVPSLPHAEGGGLACARCGNAVDGTRPATKKLAAAALHGIDLSDAGHPNPHRRAATPSTGEVFPADETWDLGQEVRRLRAHFPMSAPATPMQSSAPLGDELAGLGGASLLQMSWPPAAQPSPRPTPTRLRPMVWLSRLAGVLGLATLGVGGGLLVASSMFGQAGLWRPGLLTLAVGHLALLIGLLLWLGQVGARSREAVERLTHLDHRLRDLHHSTQLLGTTRSSASQAFYSHLAEGASPNLLLADLKGQLDLLAVRFSQRP